MVGNGEIRTVMHSGGSVEWCHHYGKSFRNFFLEVIHRITILFQKSQVPVYDNGSNGRRCYEIKKKEANRPRTVQTVAYWGHIDINEF